MYKVRVCVRLPFPNAPHFISVLADAPIDGMDIWRSVNLNDRCCLLLVNGTPIGQGSILKMDDEAEIIPFVRLPLQCQKRINSLEEVTVSKKRKNTFGLEASCNLCGAEDIVYNDNFSSDGLTQFELQLCANCFISTFDNRLSSALAILDIPSASVIALPVSGQKDSVAALVALSNSNFSKSHSLSVLHIHDGCGSHSDMKLKHAVNVAEGRSMQIEIQPTSPLLFKQELFSLKEELHAYRCSTCCQRRRIALATKLVSMNCSYQIDCSNSHDLSRKALRHTPDPKEEFHSLNAKVPKLSIFEWAQEKEMALYTFLSGEKCLWPHDSFAETPGLDIGRVSETWALNSREEICGSVTQSLGIKHSLLGQLSFFDLKNKKFNPWVRAWIQRNTGEIIVYMNHSNDYINFPKSCSTSLLSWISGKSVLTDAVPEGLLEFLEPNTIF